MKQVNVLRLSYLLSDSVWSQVQFWSPFSQTIIGIRFVQCLDEITILLVQIKKMKKEEKAESIKKIKLLISESLVWLDKSRRRRLINNEDYQNLYTQFKSLSIG